MIMQFSAPDSIKTTAFERVLGSPRLALSKGPSGRHGRGRTEETHKHYNGVCLSDYLACA